MKTNYLPVLEKVRQETTRINSCRHTSVPSLFELVRDVVVVASSSRGGSSIFTEILRHSPELLHFKGEINPFLALAGLSYPNSNREGDVLEEEDASPENMAKLSRLEQEMALDIGTSGEIDLGNHHLLNQFKQDIRWRLCVQWPELQIDRNFLFAEIDNTLDEMRCRHGWQERTFEDAQIFHTILLYNLSRKYKSINPYYYDLRPDLINEYCPDTQADFASPSSLVIEEPPFVPIKPLRAVSPEMVGTMPLIFKTPSNVYRLDFLRRLFPRAKFRIIHLVRNPADSINGLVDGWLYNGFFSHNIGDLNIKGYSDRFPTWAKSWWKYDLPPAWQKLRNRPLEYVCGHQWQSAHRAILNYFDRKPTEYLRVKFEDVIGPTETRTTVFKQISQWLGINGTEILKHTADEDLPPVMTTTSLPPRKRRWFKKAELIRPVLTDPEMEILSTAHRLGYSLNEEIS